MQVEITPINASSKTILMTVEPERVDKFYQKYLLKAAKDVVVPGFRKGKAPLAMVERMYAERIEDYFMKDVVDDVFDEAAREHDIHYLLYPEVKDIKWEKGTEMVITIEIETEPELEFKQVEGLSVPHQPMLLEDEVMRYLDELQKENSTMVDVPQATDQDEVECELTVELNAVKIVETVTLEAGEQYLRGVPALMDKAVGDVVETTVSGKILRFALIEHQDKIDLEQDYPVSIMVNSILHKVVPALDDEFAKDMEFDSLDAMKAKIADDMRLKNEHQNININNSAYIAKLYVDNNFPLPMKTLDHIAQQQIEGIDDPKWKDYYLYQMRMQIAQEMIHLYIINSLKRLMPVELAESDTENYIIHQAILEGITAEAFKEANKKELTDPEFVETVKNFTLLCRLSATCEYYIPEPVAETGTESEDEMDETVVEEIDEALVDQIVEKIVDETATPKKSRSKKE